MHPPQGRHDAIVVDAQWLDDSSLQVSVALTDGELKGAVVDLVLGPGTATYDAALVTVDLVPDDVMPGDDGATAAFLAMPCTLVVAVDGDRVGYALAPP